jgi:hypothetical protein
MSLGSDCEVWKIKIKIQIKKETINSLETRKKKCPLMKHLNEEKGNVTELTN